jgi:hypothetical protein
MVNHMSILEDKMFVMNHKRQNQKLLHEQRMLMNILYFSGINR